MRSKMLSGVLVTILMPLVSCSVASGAGTSKPKDPANAAAPHIDHAGVTSIKQVIENAARMNDQQVDLSGSFRGWSGCPASTMITRSDWVLEDETGCIYVTGTFPAGVSPEKAKGERVQVFGRVVADANGKPTFKADRAISLP